MNFKEIIEAVRDDIDEDTAAFWSDDLIKRYVNRAYKWARFRVMSFDAGFFEREVTVTYPADTRQVRLYTLSNVAFATNPERVLLVEDITTDANKPTILDRIEKHDEDLFRDRGEVFVDSKFKSIPGYYLTSESSGADPAQVRRTTAIGIRPIPSGSRTLRITYVAGAADLVDAVGDVGAVDEPDIPTPFHEVIVLRAVVLAKKREEAPVGDYEMELQRVLQDAINAVDGSSTSRTRITEPDRYNY